MRACATLSRATLVLVAAVWCVEAGTPAPTAAATTAAPSGVTTAPSAPSVTTLPETSAPAAGATAPPVVVVPAPPTGAPPTDVPATAPPAPATPAPWVPPDEDDLGFDPSIFVICVVTGLVVIGCIRYVLCGRYSQAKPRMQIKDADENEMRFLDNQRKMHAIVDEDPEAAKAGGGEEGKAA